MNQIAVTSVKTTVLNILWSPSEHSIHSQTLEDVPAGI